MPARIGLPVKTRVLVLGNDSTLGRDVVATLRYESCDIFSVADFREALVITRAGDIDVLVLDLGSHSKALQQLASQFSLTERCRRTLVLADSLEQLTFASETRVDGVLIKPLDPNQVRTVFRNLLAGACIRAPIQRSRPGIAPFLEALPSRGDWGVNE